MCACPRAFAGTTERLHPAEGHAQDNQATLARWYGGALTTGLSIDDIRSWPDRIRAVTAEQVRAAAATWLDKKRSVTGYLIKDTAPKREEKRS